MEIDNHRECVHLVKELDAPVKHIILTTHAYEHKIFISPFQRRFPEAQVYVVPKCALLLCSALAAAHTAQPIFAREVKTPAQCSYIAHPDMPFAYCARHQHNALVWHILAYHTWKG